MFSLTALIAGIVFGLRHALEPDHLAAVSTLAPEAWSGAHSKWEGLKRSAWLGASWGLGHALTLALVTLPLALVGSQVPPSLAAALEAVAACLLLLLGARSVWRALKEGREGRPHAHAHSHGEHAHAGPSDHVHFFGTTWATRPLWVGAVHGLAGSGALTALLLTDLPTFAARAGYLAVFALGGVVGMTALTGALGPAAATLVRARWAKLGFGVTAGLMSLGVGAVWLHAAATQLLG